MKNKFTIYDLRFTIWEKSATCCCRSSIANRQSSIPPRCMAVTATNHGDLDEDGRYAGLVSVPEAHAQLVDGSAESAPVVDLSKFAVVSLHPKENVREAMARFEAAHSELLAVTDPDTGAILGRWQGNQRTAGGVLKGDGGNCEGQQRPVRKHLWRNQVPV